MGFHYEHGNNNPHWSERYRLAGIDWAEKNAAASLLEELKSATQSELQTKLGSDLPVNRAEQIVKSSSQWRDYIEKMVEARRIANEAKINLEAIRMEYFTEQSENATKRGEMRLTGGSL